MANTADFELVINEMMTAKQKIEALNGNRSVPEYFRIMKALRTLLRAHDRPELVEELLHSRHYQELKSFFKRENLYYLRSIECVEAMNILTKNNVPDEHIETVVEDKFIKERFTKRGGELKALDFSTIKTLVHVGCGPFPETMLYILDNTPVERIVGLDIDATAVHMANLLLTPLGRSNVVAVDCAGEVYDYSEADAVYIVSSCLNKDAIVEQVIATAPAHVQILIDHAPASTATLLHDDFNPGLHKRLYLVDQLTSETSEYKLNFELYRMYDY